MSQPRLTPQAEADLDEIWLSVAEKSQIAANRLIDSLLSRSRVLTQFPEMGESCEQLLPALRMFVIGNYVIFYRSISEGVEIIRVLHGSRDVQAAFGRASDG